MGRKQDFIVESNGLCFICLKRNITLQQKLGYLKKKSDHECLPHFPIYSLQSLSRFLRIDMKEVLQNQTNIYPHSTLKAELCAECSNRMEKFSQLNQQLEKIRIEVMSSLINIHEKFIESNEEDILEEVNKIPDGWSDKLEILKNLRFQAIEKSSDLINSTAPRIKVKNLAMDVVSRMKLKLKQKSKLETKALQSTSYKPSHGADTHAIQIGIIKNEFLIESSTCENQDDNYSYYGDHHNSSELNEEEPVAPETKVDVHQLKQDTQGKTMNEANLYRRSSKITPQKLVFSPIKVNGKYRCNICSMQYKTRDAASQHHDRVHLKVRYKCDICDKVFVSRDSYSGHYRAVHLADAGLTCNKCNKTFTTKSNVERHQLMRNCNSPRPRKAHVCNLCDKSYRYVSELKEHVKAVHLKSSRQTCDLCGKVFASSTTLKRHIEMVHKRRREHRCNVCAKAYTAKYSLKYHKLTVHGRPGTLLT